MTSKNDKTAFQLGTDALSTILHPREHAQSVDDEILDNSMFLCEFKATIEQACVLADQGSSKSLAGLLDDIKFSDPISTCNTRDDEANLLLIANEILQIAESGEGDIDSLAAKARKLLAARNSACKQAK